MKEGPILFSAPMVRAILNGSKTQTRRIIKPKKGGVIVGVGGPGIAMERISDCEFSTVISPYGQPGDRLWVREAWSTHACFDRIAPAALTTRSIHYIADGEVRSGKGRPSIHMPRWASRINLEIDGVRIERLNDISDADLEAEGIQEWIDRGIDHDGYPRDAFRSLWNSINGPGSWKENPFVWVNEFKRVQP